MSNPLLLRLKMCFCFVLANQKQVSFYANLIGPDIFIALADSHIIEENKTNAGKALNRVFVNFVILS